MTELIKGFVGSKFAWCVKCTGGFIFQRTWGELLEDWARCPCCLSLIDASGEFGKLPAGVEVFTPALHIKDNTYKRPQEVSLKKAFLDALRKFVEPKKEEKQ